MKDTITLHCNSCDKDVEVDEYNVTTMVYREKIHIEFSCPNCQRVFADCLPSMTSIVLKDLEKPPF